MKTKKATFVSASLKLLSFLPAIITVLVLLSSCAAGKKITATHTKDAKTVAQEEEPFVIAEEMPMFPGGDSALLAYIGKNTKYPETAKTKNIQGRVIVRFCVTKTGSVDKISVLRSVNSDLDAEAIRVVNTLPAFTPGRQGGKEVPVWYMVPVIFALN
jgi:protein TonB